ncbi:MAG TPA: discoidin domain-containing protein [Acidobacteriaceae bacterium]
MPRNAYAAALLPIGCAIGLAIGASALRAQTIDVDIAPGDAVNRFVPQQTLGAGLDRISVEAIDKALTPKILAAVAPSGWQPITYRQNTELAVEAWHWNPTGTWSEPAGRGYFTGSTTLGEPIRYSYGYSLPRRGFTRNDGTGNSGYSRLTDGDANTFWKSNPYLTQRYTGEADDLHPQWVVIDLKSKEVVDAIRIDWAAPFATHYLVQYWTGLDPIGRPTEGIWQTFPDGAITAGKGGTETISLTHIPQVLQFVRILMTGSSNTCDADGASDPRNCVGYAIRELYLGTLGPRSEFHDLIRHTADQDQTTTYCSSVDPWHTKDDLLNTRQAQTGFDFFYTSGITHGLPAMIPIAMLYGQPDDAAAQIKYIEERHYPLSYVEMGEEADGQYTTPEDYAALYIQFAAALHKVDPNLKLGGPAFQGVNEDIQVWPDANGNASWFGRFLDYLKAHGRMQDLAFFSFEHYPLNPCAFDWGGLYEEPQRIEHIVQVWHNDGLPKDVPFFITESNLSSSASEAYLDNFAGLWLADYIGSFLTAGGNGVYYFHYLPLQEDRGCSDSPGVFGMFTVDKDYNILQPLSQFFASELINTEWVQPGTQENTIFPASSAVNDGAGHMLVTAYADLRPDKQWSVMLVNRDQEVAHTVKIAFHNKDDGRTLGFSGAVHAVIFGKEQYAWHPPTVSPLSHPEHTNEPVMVSGIGHADPDGPPKQEDLQVTSTSGFEIPPASIMVIRGSLAVQ